MTMVLLGKEPLFTLQVMFTYENMSIHKGIFKCITHYIGRFRKNYYSSSLMTMVLLGKEPLDTLQEI